MNNNTKKIWSPNINLDTAVEISKTFLQKCNAKQLITQSKFSLFHVYKVDKDWPLENLIEVSRFFKFSKNDVPETDRARESIIKLLAAVTKAHFYFDEQSLIKNEPYVFSIPDIFKSGQYTYGLIYHLEKNNKAFTLIVSEWNIALSASGLFKCASWDKYTSIITDDNEQLFNIEKLRKLKSMDNHMYFTIKDWKSKQSYQQKINEVNQVNDFNFGKILPYDPDLKETYSSISYIEWSKGIKKWFIPKGVDYKELTDYLEYVKKQIKKDD